MPQSARRAPPWWIVWILALYVMTQGVNTWQEVFGPGSVGIIPGETHFSVIGVTPGLPLDIAGVRTGDTIETVDGIPIANWADWFVVRANFRRNVETPMQLRRGDDTLTRAFVIRSTNWEQWSWVTGAFQAARWVALMLAGALIFLTPRHPSAWWLAWILCAIAVTEGNPSAGWLSTVRTLPAVLAVAVAAATASWLFVPALWLGFCRTVTRHVPWARAASVFAALHVLFFGAFVALSIQAMVFRAPGLAMPMPFTDVGATRVVAGLFSVTPQLFLNPWLWYTPERQSLLLGGWLAMSGSLLLLGALGLAATYRSLHAGLERRRVAALLLSVGCMGLVGVHNVLMRNWESFAQQRPPWLGEPFVVAEAVVFALAAVLLCYAVVRTQVARSH